MKRSPMNTSYGRKERRRGEESLPARHFDHLHRGNLIKVLPGEYKVTAEPTDLIVTTLGSCVSACIRDPRTGLGGMNHFMLPLSRDGGGTWAGASKVMRYGNHAMETLINEIVRTGCPRSELEIKVFGGGNVMKGRTDIGHQNARFVMEYLKNEGLEAVAADLGGDSARRIYYSPADGSVKRLLLKRSSDEKELKNSESSYTKRLENQVKHEVETADDDIELFD